jgi:alkylation response protein AidB-like acyl-CoA dehydrogenase
VTGAVRESLDLGLSAEDAAFAEEASAWLRENRPSGLPSMDTAEGFAAHREWERTLHAAGWSVVAWPREHGGRDADLIRWLLFEEAYYRSGAPSRVNQNGLFLLGPTLLEYGTPEQQARFLGPMAAGEEIWCQGWSEPDAGSDMASIRATAAPRDGGYVLNGQKTWVSRGAYADWLFGLFRSEAGSERHRGLSFLLVPMDAEGVTVRPIRQLDGETGFAEVFFDDVFVPEAQLVGAPGAGWKIAMATAGFERGLLLRSPGRFLAAAQRLVDLQRTRGTTATRDRVIDAWMDAEAHKLYAYWTVSHVLEGHAVGAEASLNKIFWSELDIGLHEAAMELLGESAELASEWSDGLLFSLAGPIYAGTNQIQRNIIADRVLRLPKG